MLNNNATYAGTPVEITVLCGSTVRFRDPISKNIGGDSSERLINGGMSYLF